jgi:hypothetical protein
MFAGLTPIGFPKKVADELGSVLLSEEKRKVSSVGGTVFFIR